MSTYSNEPQQNNWELWFIASVILFLSIFFWGIINNSESLTIIYNALLLTSLVNLVYCIYRGLQK